MAVQDEVLVRRVRVQTGGRVLQLTVGLREPQPQLGPQPPGLLGPHWRYAVGVDGLAAVMARRLEATSAHRGDPVEEPLRGLPDEDREPVRSEPLRPLGPEPEHHLALHGQLERAADQLRHPRPRGQHEAAGFLRAPVGPDPHARTVAVPFQEPGVKAQLRAVGDRQLLVGPYAGFGKEDARPRLVQRLLVVGQPEGGEPGADVGGAQQLVGQAVLPGAAQGSGHQGAGGRAHHETAADAEEFRAGALLEVLPQLVRPQQQGHVVGVLEVRLSRDAGVAVAGASVVAGPELLKAQNPKAAASQVVGG
ncbi:hypothetical protein HRbin31_00467 [bacterium HR31]|nr:hypothetical protein HRbin31_00467 [bacterium HR31]